jgi:hypothetical protein
MQGKARGPPFPPARRLARGLLGEPIVHRAQCVRGALLALGVLVASEGAAQPPRRDDAPRDPRAAEAATVEAAPHDPSWLRGRPRTTRPEEVALWVPRVLFAPLHLVAEAVRQPLLALLAWAEQSRLFAILPSVFHPIDELWWNPTLSLEAGLFALPGLTFRLEDLGVAGHGLRVAGSFGGDEFWSVSARDQWQFGPLRLGARGGYASRPNHPFFGLGPRSPRQYVFYRSTVGEAHAFAVIEHDDRVELELSGGYADEQIGPGYAPSIELDPAAIARLGLRPVGLVLLAAELRLDTRREIEENGGVHLHAAGLFGVAVDGAPTRFARFDVDLEGAIAVGPDRVLAVRGHLIETIAIEGGPIPFLHQPTLGWDLHRGFVGGRFRGEAAIVAEFRYRYPIHYFVDMEWALSAGNVFSRDFSDFEPGALTGALSVGLRTRRTGFDPVDLALAFGTTPFEDFGLDGVRFYVASTHGL